MSFKIGIIVTWFGPLPAYFDAWLMSAERNTNINFLCFSDHEIKSASPNIIYYKTTFGQTVALCEQKLGRKVSFANSYKFCDARLFFGQIYEDYLRGYDFWGYCDIDLMFGDIRSFLTDEILQKYDRVFQYGHLCIYRNNEQMKHLFNLPGSIYKLNEILMGSAKTTPEEHWGANRICEKNKIRWYTNVVFADLFVRYPDRLNITHGLVNYEKQLFFWQDGKVERIYEENGETKMNEFVYIHWQKRKPIIAGDIRKTNCAIITSNKIIATELQTLLVAPPYELNLAMTDAEIGQANKAYIKKKLLEFLHCSLAQKKIWLRQMFYRVTEKQKYN